MICQTVENYLKALNGYLRWIQEGEAILKAEEEAEILQTRLSIRAKRRATALPAGFGIPGEEQEEDPEDEVVEDEDDFEEKETWGLKIERAVETSRKRVVNFLIDSRMKIVMRSRKIRILRKFSEISIFDPF